MTTVAESVYRAFVYMNRDDDVCLSFATKVADDDKELRGNTVYFLTKTLSKVASVPADLAAAVIFAIHSAGGGFDQSVDLTQAFLAPGYRVVAPSRFGYLRTPLPETHRQRLKPAPMPVCSMH